MSYDHPNCYQRCLFSFQNIIDLEKLSEELEVSDFDEVLGKIEDIFGYFPGLRDQSTNLDPRTGVNINPLGIIFDELCKSRSDLDRLRDFITKIKRQFPAYLEALNAQINLSNDNAYEKNIFQEIIDMRDLIVINQKRSALLVLGRTIEEMLHKIGIRRKLNRSGVTIVVNGRNKRWEELTFREMNEVLHRVPITNRRGASTILLRRTKEEIDPLIIYRNFGAHRTQRTINIEEKAINYLNIGCNVLKELCEIHKKISEHSRIYYHRIVANFS